MIECETKLCPIHAAHSQLLPLARAMAKMHRSRPGLALPLRAWQVPAKDWQREHANCCPLSCRWPFLAVIVPVTRKSAGETILTRSKAGAAPSFRQLPFSDTGIRYPPYFLHPPY